MMVLKATDFLASFNEGKVFPYEKIISYNLSKYYSLQIVVPPNTTYEPIGVI